MTGLLLSLFIFLQPPHACVPTAIAYAYNTTQSGHITPQDVINKTKVQSLHWFADNLEDNVDRHYPELKLDMTRTPTPPFIAVSYSVEYRDDGSIAHTDTKYGHAVYVYTGYSGNYLYVNGRGNDRGMSGHGYFTQDQLKLFTYFFNIGAPLNHSLHHSPSMSKTRPLTSSGGVKRLSKRQLMNTVSNPVSEKNIKKRYTGYLGLTRD